MRICDLLNPQSVRLNVEVSTKEQAINNLVDLVAQSGCLNDAERFRTAVFDREAKVSTGLGEGVAIPHAKSAGVTKPGLAAMVVPQGVEFDSLDGKPAKLFFMIASPHHASDAHLDVLARLSTLLISEEFRNSLNSAQSVDEFLKIINKADEAEIEKENARKQKQLANEASKGSESDKAELSSSNKGYYDIVAVTACPAGLSHTYMAAEALEKQAKEMGISIKVETDGAAGNRNKLLPEEISKAKAVIVAADRIVDMDRFLGKPLIRVGVVEGIRHPKNLIKSALDPKCPKYQSGFLGSTSVSMRLYRHLMSGMAYLMPLAATAGILSAFARLDIVNDTQVGFFFDRVGYSIGTLLFPILSAFIAYSIRGRTALVAGFTGGVMADLGGSGVIGAVINGFVGGAVALLTTLFAGRFLKGHDATVALLLYPLMGALGTAAIAVFFTNIPAQFVDVYINSFFSESSVFTLIMIGALLAGMMSYDMGGPINKMAYAIGVLFLADSLPEQGPGGLVMASIMAGGMVPPIAAALASILVPQVFTSKINSLRFITLGKGLVFITEGIIPYLQTNPKIMKTACVACSALSGGLSMYFKCSICAPHGGIFIIPLCDHPIQYIISMASGIVVGIFAFSVIHLRSGSDSSEKVTVNSENT